jgi:hypothetical protein
MKKLALVWIILATILAATTTILQIEPAATFIRLFADSRGSFPLIVPLGAIFIIAVLPLFPIMFINNLIQNKKNKMPADLTGKTGIVVHRDKELANAALMYKVMVDGAEKSKVGMGKRVFIELPAGNYQLQIQLSNKVYSAVLPVHITEGAIVAFQTKNDLNKSLTTLVPKGEMLILVQVPFKK